MRSPAFSKSFSIKKKRKVGFVSGHGEVASFEQNAAELSKC